MTIYDWKSRTIVHFLHHGVTPCGMQGVPRDWPKNDFWSSQWDQVNCEKCLETKPPKKAA